MPSYYDSTKKKPGKAKLKYKKGGFTPKRSKLDNEVRATLRRLEKEAREKKFAEEKKSVYEKFMAAKSKKMAEGGKTKTVARGSGAARTQYFWTN
ncbi:MAG: hypothetical protein CMK72_00245 [Pseudomonadaceae bacterium]|nr:hypothetical protein [Pseudomonadaceae bacterium]